MRHTVGLAERDASAPAIDADVRLRALLQWTRERYALGMIAEHQDSFTVEDLEPADVVELSRRGARVRRDPRSAPGPVAPLV